MDDKKKAFLFALPVLGVVGGLKLLTVLYTLLASFRDSRPNWLAFQGEWIGLDEYISFMKSSKFLQLLGNSLELSLSAILLTCVMAFLLTWCIANMPKRWMKLVAFSILSVSLFLPLWELINLFISVIVYIENWICTVFNFEAFYYLAIPDFYTFNFSFAYMLRNIVIPVILGVLVCDVNGRFNTKKVFWILCGYALICLTMLLSPDFYTVLYTYQPRTFAVADTFDTYSYRNGYLQNYLDGNYSMLSASWIMKTTMQTIVNVGVIFGLHLLSKRFPKTTLKLNVKGNVAMRSVLGIVGYVLLAVGSIWVVYCLFVVGFKGDFGLLCSGVAPIESIADSLTHAFLVTVLCGVIAVFLSYPMQTKSNWYAILLLILLTVNYNVIGEGYLLSQIKSLKILHDIVDILINNSSIFIMSAIGLNFAVSHRIGDGMPNVKEYLKASVRPLIGIMVLCFIIKYGDKINSTISDLFYAELIDMKMSYAFTFTASIIPVILGTALIWLEKFFGLAGFAAFSRR